MRADSTPAFVRDEVRVNSAGPKRIRSTWAARPAAAALLISAVAAISATGCSSELAPGEWGSLRYFAEVPGRTPLRLLPPITDRGGRVYVLHGNEVRAEARAFVGQPTGSWYSGCELHEGDTRGVHNWVGSSDDRAWYWSGTALVEVNGPTGTCGMVLDRDPSSATDLRFLGVFPWIDDSPSVTRVLALAGGRADPVPFFFVVDLDIGVYTNVRRFEPEVARNLVVAGVGASGRDKEAYLLVAYDTPDGTHTTEARILDRKGTTLSSVSPFERVRGNLEGSKGLVAGLLDTGELLLFTRDKAWVEGSKHPITPIGVHRWHGTLWLVGTINGQPHVARITRDGVETPVPWQASQDARDALAGGIEVIDDRNDPSRRVQWELAESAMGEFPFLSPFSPFPYANGKSGWLVSGPFFQTGVEGMTAVAYGAVGISYP
jgi:hypothetical protein